MRIAIVTMALRVPTDHNQWITVPPQGYAGVHWVVANLIDGLLSHGHTIHLLGAPGSQQHHRNHVVVPIADIDEMHAWLRGAEIDLVHDHTCGQLNRACLPRDLPFVSTHHMTGRGKHPETCIYLSRAHREAACSPGAPIIRIPVNPSRYQFRTDKEDYLLFLGRVSKFKGAYEAAAFACAAGRKLVIAGPSWEEDYAESIRRDFGNTTDFVGEVGGARRLALISGATAVMAMSQTVMGPWGDLWCEPGSTVVSEAAVSGTPVIGTSNGCLAEIVPSVGSLVPEGHLFTRDYAHAVLAELPKPQNVRDEATRLWDYREIARQHESVYRLAIGGATW